MSNLQQTLSERAEFKCELCQAEENLAVHHVAPHEDDSADTSALLCQTCRGQLEPDAQLDSKHWFCLQESIWSQHAPVQVLSWRLLTQLKAETWAQDLLDQAYLEEETMAWAQSAFEKDPNAREPTLDSFGQELQRGDNIVLTKALNVKGTSFTARHGTVVKNIRLTKDPGYIEGKINGTVIMIKTEFTKKG